MPFPKQFLWGASTSAYQVEGGVQTQWSQWETANARRLADTAAMKYAWLPHKERIMPQITNPENYINGRSIEHYERYEADFDIAKQLHMNAFRFGVEWARLQPAEGQWDEVVVRHYHDYIAALKARGIEPVLTIWHWTMPTWFTDKGGFERRANLDYFSAFVQRIAKEYGGTVRYVLTLNEPNVYTLLSYAAGEWPPQSKNKYKTLRVYRNLVVAHRRAYRVLKAENPNLQVGVAAHLTDMRCQNSHNPLNRLTVASLSYAWNWWFLNRVQSSLDFVGLNYYFTEYRDWRGRVRNPDAPISDLGWYMEPSGIGRLLHAAHRRFRKPVLITENGLADAADKQRQWWINETLDALQAALANGVPLIGYLHWSLLDNFEWADGWWPQFGLVSVDRSTMQRSVRPSARWYGEQIKRYRHEA